MNWYKLSQQEVETYTDIGHIGEGAVLWISDLAGGNFKMKEVQYPGDNHDVAFGISLQDENFWGRYDPRTKTISIMTPYVTGTLQGVEIKDIPNRLIRRLENEFSGASVYAFTYNDNPTRIV